MDIVELQIHTEEDGVGYCIENNMINIDLLDDVILADMIEQAKLLLDEINTYINDKVEEMREASGDDCDCNGF